MTPCSARLRKQILQMPNLRNTPRGRPQSLQRLSRRTGNLGSRNDLAIFDFLATANACQISNKLKTTNRLYHNPKLLNSGSIRVPTVLLNLAPSLDPSLRHPINPWIGRQAIPRDRMPVKLKPRLFAMPSWSPRTAFQTGSITNDLPHHFPRWSQRRCSFPVVG